MLYIICVPDLIDPNTFNRNSVQEREILGFAFRGAKPLQELKSQNDVDKAVKKNYFIYGMEVK